MSHDPPLLDCNERNAWSMFFLASTDPSLIAGFDGRIQRVNPAALDLLGFGHQQMLGRPLLDFVDADDHSIVTEILRQLIVHGGSHRIAAKFKCKDGTRKHMDFTLSGVVNQKLIKAAGREIIALTSAEKELERIRDDYAGILNSITEGVHWVGSGGIIQFENPAAAKMLGYEIKELLGQHAHEVMHHHRADGSVFPVSECPIYATLADGVRRHVTNEIFWRKDGTSFAVEYTSTPTHNQNGEPNGSVVTFIDATEKRKLEAAIQNARLAAEANSRAKSEFVSNMSHEFRTPLNGIIGLSEQLLSGPLDPAERDCVNNIRISGESLLVIANNILDSSKIEAGKLTLETCEFDPRGIVNQVTDLFKAQAQSKGLSLVATVKPEIPVYLHGDSSRLRQILCNLIGNAVKFTSQGGVTLNVFPVAPKARNVVLRFEVRDTGIGIAPEAQSKLFTAFSQADGSNTRKFGGTGLGLAISKRLVELMHGTIGFESQPGQGSCFGFEIPFGKLTTQTGTLAHKDLKGLHILIVSDNATDGEVLTGYTNTWSIRSIRTSSGDEAMSILRKSIVDDPYELAILNLQAQNEAGLDLARTIRREPLLSSVKLIMLAPPGIQVDDVQVKAADIAGLLPKPLDQEQLLNLLTNIMSGTIAQREKQITTSGSLPKHYREVRQKKEIKILLAEDNRINQMVFLSVLQKLGYGASLAINGLEVLQAMNKDDYDLIFMDCQMPEMDGYEATRQIRAGKWRQPRIIAITANIMHGDDECCRGAGMDDYMSKPVRIEKLREMMDRWLPR